MPASLGSFELQDGVEYVAQSVTLFFPVQVLEPSGFQEIVTWMLALNLNSTVSPQCLRQNQVKQFLKGVLEDFSWQVALKHMVFA